MSRISSIGAALGAVVLLILAWKIIGRGLNPESAGVLLSLLDSAKLILHEAGHVLFLPFGGFFIYLGGSLT